MNLRTCQISCGLYYNSITTLKRTAVGTRGIFFLPPIKSMVFSKHSDAENEKNGCLILQRLANLEKQN